MAGHSKWTNIKFRKIAQDSRRSKLFTKYIHEITVSTAQEGGADPQCNLRLRRAIDKALAANMAFNVIDRAIKRGFSVQNDVDIEEIRYEGYAAHGIALMVDCLTNNRKRTVSDIRHVLLKQGGHLKVQGSVSYLFIKKGQICLNQAFSEEMLINIALKVGAEDVYRNIEGALTLITTFEDLGPIQQRMKKENFNITYAKEIFLADREIPLKDPVIVQQFLKLIQSLEGLEDVHHVYSNAKVDLKCLSGLEH